MTGVPARPTAVDVHQHLWPEELVDRLRARTRPPYLRGWTLHTRAEPAYDVEPADHDPRRRVELDHAAGVGLACVSLSAPLGIENLVRPEAGALLAAWHDGARRLPDHFAPWASVPMVDPDLDGLAALLADRFVGVQLPATDLASPAAWERAGDVLRVAERAGKPVFVHPGPEPVRPLAGRLPGWLAPVVGYVTQLQAAWWAWHALGGRDLFPSLRVLFAAGAGLAPVHHERHARAAAASRPDRSGRVRRDVVVRTAGARRAGAGPRRRRPRARQRPAVRRPARAAARRRGDPRDPGGEPGAGPARRGRPGAAGGGGMGAGQLSDVTLPADRAVDLRPRRGTAPPRRPAGPRPRPGGAARPRRDDRVRPRLVGAPGRLRRRPSGSTPRCTATRTSTCGCCAGRRRTTPAGTTTTSPRGRWPWSPASSSRTTSPWRPGECETRIGAGRAFSFGPEHIHRLNGAVAGSVSVHAYSPPLWRMGQYAVSDAGVLRRVSVSYADELRPLD